MHVREWLPNELYNLLSNSGLNIVYISQQENSVGHLQKKHPSEVNLGNQMFVIQNNNIKFIDQKVKNTEIFGIIVLNSDIRIDTIINNCEYMNNQFGTVFELALDMYGPSLEQCNAQTFLYQKPREMLYNLQILIDRFPVGSWFYDSRW